MKGQKFRASVLAFLISLLLTTLSIGVPGANAAAETEGLVNETTEHEARKSETPKGLKDTWTIFVYLCGTDLESLAGMGTFNIEQMLQTAFPENVQVIIQTGGTESWGNLDTDGLEDSGLDFSLLEQHPIADIDPTVLQRYKVTDELTLVDEQPLRSMGSAKTLYDFLSWGIAQYPAEKMGVILWDHGSALLGVCSDELFVTEDAGADTLFLFELEDAFARLSGEMTDRFEFIGFDACLMSSIEVASVVAPYARYMYASEEVEPGFGWDYTVLLSELARNPGVDGKELGIALCDGYIAFYRRMGQADACTLSVTDLGKVDSLLGALDAVASVLNDNFFEPAYFAGLARGVSRAEHYSIQWMVDLGDMAEKLHDLAPLETSALQAALEEAIVHSVSGSARAYANGLSIFYPTSDHAAPMEIYDISFPNSDYTDLMMKIDRDYRKYIYSNEEIVSIVQEPAWDDANHYTMQVDPSTLEHVREIGCMLFEAEPESSDAFLLGISEDVIIDWNIGIVQDAFDAFWPHIEDQPLAVVQMESNKEYVILHAAILLNGKPTNLVIKHEKTSAGSQGGTYEILGTWDGIDPYTGTASRFSRPLQAGDAIKPIYASFPVDAVMSDEYVDIETDLEEGDIKVYYGKEILVRKDTEIASALLDANRYLYQFSLITVYGNEITYAPTMIAVDEMGQVSSYNAATQQ